MGVLRSAAHRRAESRFWGVFIIAVHRAFVLGLGARHRGIVELSALGRGDRLGAASSVSYGALNSAIWYARVCTTQSRSRQLKLDSPIGPKLWT